jgi:uncharacterized Rmd1/YagE family protein
VLPQERYITNNYLLQEEKHNVVFFSFGIFFFWGKKVVNFLNFFRSVNLTNSANFWEKSPTFNYQKIEEKKI